MRCVHGMDAATRWDVARGMFWRDCARACVAHEKHAKQLFFGFASLAGLAALPVPAVFAGAFDTPAAGAAGAASVCTGGVATIGTGCGGGLLPSVGVTGVGFAPISCSD
mmetsp:Transcript_6369/g.17019  ORF Transcript_6369/g.17019 Transcript_6369/m.17019 type:complete len:109 (+) Transcript_6369:92-418(+)